MPLSLCVLYASCNVYSISLTEVYLVYSFYFSCLNSFYSCTLYIEKELYHAFPHFPLFAEICATLQIISAFICVFHSSTSVTTPAPTVLPPSLMANRNSFSIAIGAIRSTVRFMLSPGITISTPSGSWATPVTSVVLK
jgi:hypothetical protein